MTTATLDHVNGRQQRPPLAHTLTAATRRAITSAAQFAAQTDQAGREILDQVEAVLAAAAQRLGQQLCAAHDRCIAHMATCGEMFAAFDELISREMATLDVACPLDNHEPEFPLDGESDYPPLGVPAASCADPFATRFDIDAETPGEEIPPPVEPIRTPPREEPPPVPPMPDEPETTDDDAAKLADEDNQDLAAPMPMPLPLPLPLPMFDRYHPPGIDPEDEDNQDLAAPPDEFLSHLAAAMALHESEPKPAKKDKKSKKKRR